MNRSTKILISGSLWALIVIGTDGFAFAQREPGLDAEKIMEVCLNGLHVQVRPPGEQFGRPVITTPIVHVIREFRPMPDWLAEDGSHDALWCPLHQLADEVAGLREELSAVHERLDFTERLLSQISQAHLNPSSNASRSTPPAG